jgi:hypothetical protein
MTPRIAAGLLVSVNLIGASGVNAGFTLASPYPTLLYWVISFLLAALGLVILWQCIQDLLANQRRATERLCIASRATWMAKLQQDSIEACARPVSPAYIRYCREFPLADPRD